MMTATLTRQDDARMTLTARRAELTQRLARLASDRRRELDPLSADADDQAIQRENDEVIDSIAAATQGELQAIDAALRRLDEGRYGVCEICRNPIEPSRLRALPQTTECQHCASESAS